MKIMADARRYALAPDAVLKVTGDEALILKLNDETMFSLNATGARIAELIVEGLAIDAIVAALADEYKASPSDVESDVTNLLESLLSGGLVVAID
jgi:Coenzyme PQQ synthesis protein D (PqqD)